MREEVELRELDQPFHRAFLVAPPDTAEVGREGRAGSEAGQEMPIPSEGKTRSCPPESVPIAARSAGWDNWNLPHREKTSRYAEFRSTGPGAKPGQRAKWAKQLAETEATEFIAGMVLHGQDGWNPTAATGKCV